MRCLRTLGRVSSSLSSPFRGNLERLLREPTSEAAPPRRRRHRVGQRPNAAAVRSVPAQAVPIQAHGPDVRVHPPEILPLVPNRIRPPRIDNFEDDEDDGPLPPLVDPHEHMDTEMVRLARLNLVSRILDGEARVRLEAHVRAHVERRLGGNEGVPIPAVVRVRRRQPQQSNVPPMRAGGLGCTTVQDLVGQMDDLRRGLKTVLTLQLDIQRSIKMEVACAISGAQPPPQPCRSRPQSESNCVVCLEAGAECVVVRCGHWCLCQSCGLEIKSKRMPCPICRAPVVDIMTVYR